MSSITGESAAPATAPFLKGHGTENDFVVLPDVGAGLRLEDPNTVRALCNRRAGVGGDGILRIARAGELREAGELAEIPADVEPGDWFMDYRNADGSVAEMCGNGVRVFAHALVATGLAPEGEIRVGTRAGLRPATVSIGSSTDAATVSVGMGTPEVIGVSTVSFEGRAFAGLAVDVGNPHVAAIVPRMTSEQLDTLPIASQPVIDQEFFPAGVNVEIATPMSEDGLVHMRVHERGAGETRSCGTGIVATALAALADAERSDGTVTVRVPGGDVVVEISRGAATMTGPSRLVARGELSGLLFSRGHVRE
ncbi:diaminopimelate epimerase [Dietzia sp.]|uniref:diaminopimelate epimerase n=1 Tax=Dietzia sp. TaxID=1871616 RepID=UPI002FDB7162